MSATEQTGFVRRPENPVLFLAPMAGVTNSVFRRICKARGADVLTTEFVSAEGIMHRNERTEHYVDFLPEERPLGVQLFGADPAQLARGAQAVMEWKQPDFIDINFGCPVKKVLGRCRGGYLLSQPATALEIVGRVRDAVPAHVPVTLKMRRGLDDSPASRDAFWTIFDGAFARGAAAITVHGRTVEQRYVGPSDWQFLAEVKRQAGERTVIGSGDLFSAAACVAMLERTGVDGVSVARGAIGNPWIFRQALALIDGGPALPPPTIHEQREALREHWRLAAELHGEAVAGRSMRKFAIKYARSHPEPLAVRDAFVAVRGSDDWQAVLDRFYAVDGPGRDPSGDVDETASCDPEA